MLLGKELKLDHRTIIMRYYFILIIQTMVFNVISHSQGTQEFGKIFNKSENQAPVADAGEDIRYDS